MESRADTEVVRLLKDLSLAVDQLQRILDLHGQTLHRIERKLDQHFAVVEPDPEGTAKGV